MTIYKTHKNGGGYHSRGGSKTVHILWKNYTRWNTLCLRWPSFRAADIYPSEDHWCQECRETAETFGIPVPEMNTQTGSRGRIVDGPTWDGPQIKESFDSSTGSRIIKPV